MNRPRSLFTLVSALSLLLGIGIVAGQSVRAAQVGDLTQASTTFAHFYLIRTDSSFFTYYWTSHTLVDTGGGAHVTFNDAQQVYYAHCSAGCDNSGNWTTTPIANVGPFDALAHPTLALDSSDRPRIVWYNDADYQYAECNANCANASSWTVVQVPMAEPGSGYNYPNHVRYFALDFQDRPRFVCPGNSSGFTYTTCDADCTSAANWHSTHLDVGPRVDRLQLVFNGSSQPRVMGFDPDNQLTYLGCEANCSQANNWNYMPLYDVEGVSSLDVTFSFRLDTQGRPRVAFFRQASSDKAMYYAWSNSTAITATDWLSDSLALPPYDERTVDLALDSQNRPRVAFASDQENLDYVECTANCESTNSTWQLQHIETGDELDVNDPIPATGCLSSAWMMIGYPSLALDAADQPNVSYYAKHRKYCLGNDGKYHFLTDVHGLRFARPGGSSTPTPPASVGLNGPAIGVIDISYTFTATVSPITTTQPITYVWQATGQTAQTHTGRGTSDTATFTWPSGAIGVKTIAVSASNQAGTAHGNHSILITATPIIFNHWIYLPLVIR